MFNKYVILKFLLYFQIFNKKTSNVAKLHCHLSGFFCFIFLICNILTSNVAKLHICLFKLFYQYFNYSFLNCNKIIVCQTSFQFAAIFLNIFTEIYFSDLIQIEFFSIRIGSTIAKVTLRFDHKITTIVIIKYIIT